MTDTPFAIIFYVADVAKSCAFYDRILDHKPVESSPNFAMYPLKGGANLGLWAAHDVAPAIAKPGTSDEVAFVVPDKAAVDMLCKRWREEKVVIAQELTAMDFGYTFVGLDPDGHRLRVFSVSTAS
jgi:catechol 2,3-dioxygenase-like lactoylglutathione lyase family enzyme